MKTQNLLTRAAYWSEVQKFTQSVISGLIWYIQVSLLHGGLIPDDIATNISERMKVPQSLLAYLFSEASRIFSLFYQEKSLYKFVLLDCQMYPPFNIGFECCSISCGETNSTLKLIRLKIRSTKGPCL